MDIDGDELVVLRVLDPSTSSISLSRSSLSEQAKEEASSLMRTVAERNSNYNTTSTSSSSSKHHNHAHQSFQSLSAENTDDEEVEPINEIGITIEHVIGKVQESIQKIIKVYRPDSLIVGTRGRSDSLLKSAFIGSVSRYCVAEVSPLTFLLRILWLKSQASRSSLMHLGIFVTVSSTGSRSSSISKSS